ncbi:MAG: vitamin K epoxide reductase family protein, partial [Gemmatimonadota bacterium]
ACGPGGGCDIVTTSQYATVAGVPLAVVGLVYYVVVNLIVWTPPSGWSRTLGVAFVAITAVAVTMSAFLVYLQAAVIDSWCRYCLVSAGVSTGLLLTAIALYRNPIASEAIDG